jgi:hypothetical protein
MFRYRVYRLCPQYSCLYSFSFINQYSSVECVGGFVYKKAHLCAKQYPYSTFCAGRKAAHNGYPLAVKDLDAPIGLFSMAAGFQVVSTGDLVLQAANVGVLRLQFHR